MYKMQGMGKGAVAVLVASMVLAACGGGDDGDSSSSTTSTATAAASSSSSSVASSNSSSTSSGTSTTGVSGSWIPTRSDLAAYLGTCASGNQPFAAAGTYTDGVASLYTSTTSKLRLYDSADTTSCASAGGTNGVLAVNFNATSIDTSTYSVGGTLSISSALGSIKIPYTAATTAPTLKVYYTYSSSSTYPCSTSQVVVANASGTVLSVASPCGITSQATLSATDTATVGASGAFYILFTRGTDGGGGLRVWEADYTN